MGATVGCAQCHDHKYDPYTIKDHYALASFFSDLGDRGFNGNSLPTKRPPEIQIFTPEQQSKIDQLTEEIAQALPQEIIPQWNALENNHTEFSSQLRKARNNRKDRWKKKLAELEPKYLELTDQATIDRYQALVGKKKKVENQGIWTMVSRAVKPRTMRVLPRGNWMDESGPVVLPSVPEFLGSIQTDNKRLTRLDLANWLTDTEKGIGLFNSRVLANRIWYLLFGRGLAPDLTDFGGQGTPPEHPELLDRLALSLVEKNWDLKAFIQDILLSKTYRQSTLPPAGEFSFQVARRLPAEFVRDNTLAISGLLVPTIGGPSVKPLQPAGYYRHLNFPQRTYEADKGEALGRRGLYVHWQRQFLHPMLKAFDAPSREECSAERPQSNTPLAALVLLNDPTFLEAAKFFAKKITSEGGSSVEERLSYAFQHAVSRPPDTFEQKTLAALLEIKEHTTETDWTPVARAVLNLAETNLRR